MASSFGPDEELNSKFEKWLSDQLKESQDVAIFSNFILSALNEEESEEEEKKEAIRPILQELNQVYEILTQKNCKENPNQALNFF